MKLLSSIKLSVPTKEQLKHDLWVVAVAFVGEFINSWQVHGNQLNKAAIVAACAAGFAAALTVAKSIVTTL